MKNSLRKIKIGLLFILLFSLPHMYFFKYLFDAKVNEIEPSNISKEEFVVMSYNIRCCNPTDIWKRSWFFRASLVLENIAVVKPNIIGFQEVTSIQYKYLKENLSEYESVILYRDNLPWSEGNPVFFDKGRYELQTNQSFWLSETPTTKSKSWGSADYRICTYVILKDKYTEKTLAAFNTHLDHKSEKARIQGMQIILDRISRLNDVPVVLMGDFNSVESSDTYKIVTDELEDTKYIALDSTFGNTYQNWGQQMDGEPIDYIAVTPNAFLAKKYSIMKNRYGDIYPSDHFPIYTTLKIRN